MSRPTGIDPGLASGSETSSPTHACQPVSGKRKKRMLKQWLGFKKAVYFY